MMRDTGDDELDIGHAVKNQTPFSENGWVPFGALKKLPTGQ